MPSGVQSRASTHRPVIETASTEKEARRVLEWQHDVARSISQHDSDSDSEGSQSSFHNEEYRPSAPRRYESYPQPSEPAPHSMRLVRRVTETTQHYRPRNTEPMPLSTGMSGKAIAGTLLGAMAGAAFAYAMVRSEEPEELPQDYRRPTQRRASMNYGGSRPAYSTYGVNAPSMHVVDRIEYEPTETYVTAREPSRYSHGDGNYTTVSKPPLSGRSDMHRIEGKQYYRDSDRYLNNDASATGRTRSRSFSDSGSRHDRPLTILPPPPKSRVSFLPPPAKSQVTILPAPPKSHVTLAALPPLPPSTVGTRTHVSRASSKHDASYSRSQAPSNAAKSAAPKSYVSTSTVKPITYVPPTAKSKVSATTIKMVPRSEIARENGEGSRVSARKVPLPKSVVSGVGYERSVAPSDSVSNAGGRRRSHY